MGPGPGTVHSTGGGSLPVATFQTGATSVGSNTPQTLAVSLPGSGAQQFVILGLAGASLGTAITSITLAPNVGTTVNLAQQVIDAASRVAIWSGTLLSDANSATTGTITVTFVANPSNGTLLTLWTVPLANLISTTPTTANNDNGAGTSVSTTISTTSGGFVIGVGGHGNGQTTIAISGTETYTNDFTSVSGITAAFAHANGVATNASSTVTNTVSPTSGSVRLVAAAWR